MGLPPAAFFFAAVGDTHGHMHLMVRLLQAWEQRAHEALAFVLQVGDFEPHRHDADLATMAAPARHRRLGDFPDFASRRAAFPWPVVFIGGNHEPYGFLDARPEGFELLPNCRYLGRAETMTVRGVRVAGLSGILQEDAFQWRRPPVSSLGAVSSKAFAYFNEHDVDRLLAAGRCDVLMVHDWPAGIVSASDAADFDRHRRSMRYDTVGNEYARMLVDGLRPRLVLCGHMHKAYRATVQHSSGEATRVCCLGSVEQSRGAVAVFHVTADGFTEATRLT